MQTTSPGSNQVTCHGGFGIASPFGQSQQTYTLTELAFIKLSADSQHQLNIEL